MANWVENLSDEQVDNLLKIRDAATKHGVDPKLAVALAMRESGLRNIKGAVDEHGKFAYGPMQLREAAATDMKADRFDVDQNIDAGVRYLKQHLDTFKDQNKALHAYHLGANHGTIKSGQVPADVGKYISDIHNYIKEATPEATQAKGGKEVPPLPVAERDVEIADIAPLEDWKIPPQQPQPNGASATDAIVSGSLGSLVGSMVAPSEHKQAEHIKNAATRLAEANAPIEEYNKRQLEKYNEAQELRNKAMKAFDEKNNPAGVPKYVESQVKGPSTNIIHYDPNVITNQQVQQALPGLAESHVKARQIEPQFVIDPNRGGLSVPSQHTAPPPPKIEDIFPPIEKPTLRPLKQANTPPLQSGARIGAAPGFFGGVNAADAYSAVQKQDPVGAALGSAGAVAGGLATKVANPRVNIPLTLFSASMAGAQRLRHKFQDQPATESVLNKAEGGLARIPKFAGRGEQLVKAAVKKGEELIGREPPKSVATQQPAWTYGGKPGKMSEWAQNYINQWLVPTQADRMGGVGGSSYSANQLALPEYQNRAWGSGQRATATGIANLAKDPAFGGTRGQIFAPILGEKNMHQSNQIVFDALVNEFYKHPERLTPELRAQINAYMQSGGASPSGNLKFDPIPGFEIADRAMIESLGKTFDARKAIAKHAFGGVGIGSKKAQIIPHQEILDTMSDPLTHGAPSFSIGPRAFRLTGDVEAAARPDLNRAYPYQLHGEDLGVTYTPVPSELSLMDFQSQWRKDVGKTEPKPSGALHQPGYFEHTLGYKPTPSSPRVYPRQQMTEEWVKELQRSGFARGGLTGYAGKGESLVRAGKAGLERFLAPSQEKRRLYHGTRADIKGFRPHDAVFLSPDPKFANRFAAQTDDPKVGEAAGPNPKIVEGANVMPVHVQATNIYDPLNEKQSEAMRAHLLNKHKDIFEQQDVRRMMAESADKYENWRQMEHPLMQGGLKDLGHDAFYVNERGVRNLGVYDPKRIKSAIGNEGTYDVNVNDITKAEGGLVHLQSGGSPKKQAFTRLATSAYDMLGLTPESVAAWRKTNAKPYKQQQDPVLAQATDAYLNKQISQADYLRIMNERRPIRPLTEVPGAHSNVDIVSALDPNKVDKGILGLNLHVPEGTRVGNRLDIPSYERYGIYVDTMHDTAGKPIGYGHTGHLKDVQFKSSPTKAARVGLGTKEQALTPMAEVEGQGKSPFAMMVGNQVNTSDDEVRRMLQEYLRDPEWHQIGMNPYRASQFYDKADMRPVWSAKEKVQAGPLVLARDIEKSDWTDPRLMTEFGVNYKEGGLTGLYANIHAKRERIKHGSGEKMRKPGSPGAPTADAFEESAKTAKLKEGGTPSLSVGRGEKLSVDQGAGLTAKGRAKYNRETGSNLKAPQPEGGARKDSFCARMQGVVDHAKGDAPRAKASLKRWNC